MIGSRATAFVDHEAAVAAFPEIDSDTFATCLANEMTSNATAAGQLVTKAQATRDHLSDVGDAGVVIRVHLSMARPVAGPRGRRTEVTDLWGDVEAFRIDRWAVVVARLAGQSHPLDDGPRAQLTRTLAARLLLS